MKKIPILAILFALYFQINAQVASTYEISFENAVHHEAEVQAVFTDLINAGVTFRMARTSPGRYALHEFAKNVYNVKVTDGNGKALQTVRPDPYSWRVSGHNGTIKVSYTLYGNHGDGTYAQIDETHAHLNMPAVFMYVPELEDREIEVTYNVREDLNWKIATQLKPLEGNTYYARDFQYFMDSPTEISDFKERSFDVDGQKIHLILHDKATDARTDEYFEKVKKVVLQQKSIFGELPKYDYGNYYFLACYLPQVSGDGMEHRNSTVLTSTRSLADGGMERNIGTVSHEFFHGWNVERIRPESLEPFDFEKADMSGDLWFAEGFTSYYTSLILCRAGLISQEDYVKSLTGTFNYVWNSPGRNFFNPIEMSYQAPFVDAARSVDETNRDNTFISYYSYGSMLGLALDLSLREKGLDLDDYMQLVWSIYGKTEIPYTVTDLQNTLVAYAGKEFGDSFFKNYVKDSKMPDLKRAFENVGVALTTNPDKIWFGGAVRDGKIIRNTVMGSPAYQAGLEQGDRIISLGDKSLSTETKFSDVLADYSPGDTAKVVFERFGRQRETTVVFTPSPNYTITLLEAIDQTPTKKQLANRRAWLDNKL